jgi:hypothetical protein
VRTLPKVLKFLPSDKAQDARNFVQALQYWLGGNSENLQASGGAAVMDVLCNVVQCCAQCPAHNFLKAAGWVDWQGSGSSSSGSSGNSAAQTTWASVS